MKQAVKNFAEREEHASSDSTFVVIMSHGKRDAILGVHYHKTDNPSDAFPVDDIFHHLNSENCPALRNKPKVILIQACRGGMKMTKYNCSLLNSQDLMLLTHHWLLSCLKKADTLLTKSLFRGAWARVGQWRWAWWANGNRGRWLCAQGERLHFSDVLYPG